MYTLLVVLATIYIVWFILRLFGVFEISRSSKVAVDNFKSAKKLERKRKIDQNKLKFYSEVTKMFRGLLMSTVIDDTHRYYISRLDIRSVPLNRLYTPEEVRGKYAFPFIASLLLIPLGVVFPLCWGIIIFCFARFAMYQTVFQAKIRDEDEIIDNYFIDLYLVLYPKLKQGSRARLQKSVQNYIDTLDIQTDTKVKDIMMKLSRYLLNLLAMYEDHKAVPKLKEAYRSATIINFCNVASQSLNGIENWDNLLTFRMQLVTRKKDLMIKRSDKILKSGERAIYAIWVILFIFVVVGWYSKIAGLY